MQQPCRFDDGDVMAVVVDGSDGGDVMVVVVDRVMVVT